MRIANDNAIMILIRHPWFATITGPAMMCGMNLDDLDIKQLDAFAAVMSAGSITAAARVLNRSQPTISRAIQDLENNIGFLLLSRNGPRIAPTSQGVLFHSEVERFLSGLRHIKERADAIAFGEPQPFEIASIPAFTATIAPFALARIPPGRLPRKIFLHTMMAENVVQAVSSGTAELGISSLPLDHPGVDVHWIGSAACVAVVSDSDPLVRRRRIRLIDLQDRPLIATSNPFRLRPRIDAAFRAAGLAPFSAIDTNASVSAVAAARAGMGVAVIDPVTAYGMPVDGAVVRPLDVQIPFHFGVISRSATPLAPVLAEFSDHLRQVARDTLPDFIEHDVSEMEALLRGAFGAVSQDAC
ncbi:LysR family transcriptional regulator [Nguyenibacter sp. L1]|uniref:LysR family transcriptional regulator n=1 Tax=Nguyenibacter sp. L1 TaxID=3049350 RepID=UPI002B486114|nr:LysR family transcriptional regulator [Nguyenibacter sp. L1]WRH88947.1 LysR family transcriptional regulator [Nguyenibacter sp. L1]